MEVCQRPLVSWSFHKQQSSGRWQNEMNKSKIEKFSIYSVHFVII